MRPISSALLALLAGCQTMQSHNETATMVKASGAAGDSDGAWAVATPHIASSAARMVR